MKKYNVCVDIPLDCNWEEISVESFEIEADSPQQAEENMIKMLEDDPEIEDYYIWEVLEEDEILD